MIIAKGKILSYDMFKIGSIFWNFLLDVKTEIIELFFICARHNKFKCLNVASAPLKIRRK